MGFFVGSGGETFRVWLESLDASRTRVTEKNSKSFVGIVGQKNWSDEFMREMDKALR
jgi:hypothetical protein